MSNEIEQSSECCNTGANCAPAPLLQALFMHFPQGCIVYRLVRDASGVIMDWQVAFVNACSAATMGVSTEQMLGKSALALYGEEFFFALSGNVSGGGIEWCVPGTGIILSYFGTLLPFDIVLGGCGACGEYQL